MAQSGISVSVRAAFCLIIVECLIYVGFAQVLCSNPLNIGELRVSNSKKCVDIDGNDGEGNVLTWNCDGLDDQQIIICGDGTIRNQRRNYCLQPTGSGNANVVSAPCSLLYGIPARQRWRLVNKRIFRDRGGILQVATRIINMESNKCLDVAGSNGNGNILSWTCDGLDDQFFYIRSRGREVNYGRLINERSNLCLDVGGADGKGNVGMWNCEDLADQFFRLYENGELINEASKLCIDVSGNSGVGNVGMHPCEDWPDQMWTVPSRYCNGDYCSFLNKRSHKCLDVGGSDGRGNVGTWHCDGYSDQRFKWVAHKWQTPTATWNQVGCNQNGPVSQQISNTVSFSSTITETISMEVSSTIGSSVDFIKAEVSVKVSTSLSKAWTSSRSGTSSISFTCENYDNGDDFTRGCMWQLQVETRQVSSGELLTWTPQIVKCTRSNVAPRCAPFTTCIDQDCNFCRDL